MCDLRVCVGYGMRKYERCVTTKLVACVDHVWLAKLPCPPRTHPGPRPEFLGLVPQHEVAFHGPAPFALVRVPAYTPRPHVTQRIAETPPTGRTHLELMTLLQL